MPWYAAAYLGVFIAIGIYSAYDDVRSRTHPAHIGIDAAVTLLWVYFFVAYFRPSLMTSSSVLLALLVIAVAWTIYDAVRELRGLIRERDLSYDPELSPRLNLWIDRAVEASGIALGIFVAAPALAAAVAVVRRSL